MDNLLKSDAKKEICFSSELLKYTDSIPDLTITFDISQWVLNAGFYELTLTHNLEYNDLMLEFIGSDGSNIGISRNQWFNLNTNQIVVRLSLEPDYRFSGRVIIRRII